MGWVKEYFMNPKSATAKIFELPFTEAVKSTSDLKTLRAELLAIEENGELLVRFANGFEFHCDWLENSQNANINLQPGDRLLCLPPTEHEPGIVLGRIGKYQKPQPQQNLTIEATETLTLKCGEASVELRKDGKAMVKGEDVLLRAKGTQRIRAGTVAIN
jgi:hypothetical protein